MSFGRVLSTSVVAVLVGGMCFAEKITVHLVNVESGEGVESPVILILGNPRHPAPRLVSTTSRRDGKAIFDVPAPLPSSVFVNTDNGRVAACARLVPFSTAEVIEDGITHPPAEVMKVMKPGMEAKVVRPGRKDATIQLYQCNPTNKVEELKAKPGEILIFVRPLTFWEKMQR